MADGREKQIFFSALDLDSTADRAVYLDQVCGSDEILRQEVNQLLAAHDHPSNVLDRPLVPVAHLRNQVDERLASLDVSPIVDSPPESNGTNDCPDKVIGNYRLIQKIGEGGFGRVYVAQQLQPIRRQVAIKLLKRWDGTGEILARFEAERQALAVMDHPHIAQVFDAGTTSTGQPFFVMELVRGVPITDYCEQQRFSIPQRLELFISVCQAIQHAHQKGVIHRDLKPSNVMVTLHDATPVPKVIDFGVSKAIGEPLTDKMIATRFSQMIGTPMYMSPEQAEMNSPDVDTRSDVYSLGMMLYELLTGTSPYDQKRMITASFDELRRIIREEELPVPSSRLSTLRESNSTVSENRQVTPVQLTALLRGDLDWVVMKAIEKDRHRRYESASALAADIRRHLNHEPVEARPPSTWYRWSKFARRNRVPITTASLVASAMIFGTGISIWQAALAVSERDEKEAARRDAVNARKELEGFVEKLKEVNVLLSSGRAHADARRWAESVKEYNKATKLLPQYYHVWVERGSLYVKMGCWQAAAADYSKALELDAPVTGAEWWGIPQLLLYAHDESAFRDVCQKMLSGAGNAESQSPSALRSCIFASTPITNPRQVVDWAENSVRISAATIRKGHPPGGHQATEPPPGGSGRGPGWLGSFGEFDRRPPPDAHHRPPPHPRHGPPPHGLPGDWGPGGPGNPPLPPPFQRRHDANESRNLFAAGAQPHEANLYVAGIAQYRAGDFHKALERLTASLSDDANWPAKSLNYPALAMVYHRLGHTDEAHQALKNTRETLDNWISVMTESPIGTTPIFWFDLIEFLVLYGEATLIIEGTEPQPDPRLHAIEERALSVLR